MANGHGGYREGNPTYRLTELDRWEAAVLSMLGLWPQHAVAATFGVDRKTIRNCERKYPAPMRMVELGPSLLSHARVVGQGEPRPDVQEDSDG